MSSSCSGSYSVFRAGSTVSGGKVRKVKLDPQKGGAL